MPSFSDSLLLKNVFLGLTYQLPNFPSTLHDCGYDEVFIEKAFTNSRLEAVQYDLAICAPARNRSALLEFKGGHYTNKEEQQRVGGQVQRYLAVTGQDVVQKAGFSVAPGLDPLHHRPETLIVGLHDQTDGLEAAISPSIPIPLLAASIHSDSLEYRGVERVRGTCSDPELDSRLGLLPHTYAIPMTLPFDLDSQVVDIAEAIVPAILQMFYRTPAVPTFEIREVLEQAIRIWPLIDDREQQAYIRRVRSLLNDLVAHEFKSWFEWDNRSRQWLILQPLPVATADRMRVFRRLQRLHHQALTRLGGGQLQQSALPFEGDEGNV